MLSDPEEKLRQWVGQAKDGDRRAYGRIFRICYEDIYDYIVRRVGNYSEAEDLTMQVFTQGLQAVSTYEERGFSVRAWLFRIAHNAVVDHLRTKRKSVDLEEIPEIEDGKESVESKMLSREAVRDLYKEIIGLPTAQAEVLMLRFIEDMSIAETALILGKKEATVRALQFKGIRNLKERFSEESEGLKNAKEQGDVR